MPVFLVAALDISNNEDFSWVDQASSLISGEVYYPRLIGQN